MSSDGSNWGRREFIAVTGSATLLAACLPPVQPPEPPTPGPGGTLVGGNPDTFTEVTGPPAAGKGKRADGNVFGHRTSPDDAYSVRWVGGNGRILEITVAEDGSTTVTLEGPLHRPELLSGREFSLGYLHQEVRRSFGDSVVQEALTHV